MTEPGMEYAPPAFRKAVEEEVKNVLDAIYARTAKALGRTKLMINDRIADSIFPAGRNASRRVFRARHPQPQRRLHFRRMRRAGWRPRYRPREPISATGYAIFERHPRHRSEVRRQRRHQPGIGHSLRRHAIPPRRLGRSRRP